MTIIQNQDCRRTHPEKFYKEVLFLTKYLTTTSSLGLANFTEKRVYCRYIPINFLTFWVFLFSFPLHVSTYICLHKKIAFFIKVPYTSFPLSDLVLLALSLLNVFQSLILILFNIISTTYLHPFLSFRSYYGKL